MRLKVFRVEQVCFFELGWGKGQQMTAQIAYTETLTQRYETWQTCYLDFYRTSLRSPLSDNYQNDGQNDLDGLRGRIKNSGTLSASPIDYRSRLVSAEAGFLAEFYDWLKSRELLEIRSKIAALVSLGTESDLFLTCEPLALARFPWEVWEILGEFGQRSNVRIIRTPANLRHEVTPHPRSGKMRILVILGDETGLSFHAEITALKSLERFADVQFEGWRVGQSIAGLKERIAQRLVDPEGWDILFFAGHSNESILTGGELAIGPQTSIFLREIQPQLLKAKENGLQFAIFNSCKGLDLANTLIDLGLSQVAIMREPIHNSVAQDFLIQFIQHLTQDNDRAQRTVYDALHHACQYLKLDRNLTYPSAYFIPSFFCHPETFPFTPRVLGMGHRVRALLPSRRQTITLGAILLATTITPLQDLLLDGRLMVQSIYRQTTGQIPKDRPEIKIVQIDEASIRAGLIPDRKLNPIDRTALAKTITAIGAQSPKVLAIDYLLDRPSPEDPVLAKSLAQLQNSNISLIFSSDRQALQTIGVSPTLLRTIDPLRKLARSGYINFYPGYLSQPTGSDCSQGCPFGFMAAEAYLSTSPDAKATSLPRIPAWRSTLQNFGITAFAPIVDFSIPSDRVYLTASAIDITSKRSEPSSEPIIILAAGDYPEAGMGSSTDKFPLPSAMAYWRRVQGKPALSQLTGAEIHAYMIYHALHKRTVTPIPEVLMVLLAGLFAGILQSRRILATTSRSSSKLPWNIAATCAIYGGIGLQSFISAGVLLPWLLPSLVLWIYQIPIHSRKRLP